MHIKRSLGHQAGTHLPPTDGRGFDSSCGEGIGQLGLGCAFLLSYGATEEMAWQNLIRTRGLPFYISERMRTTSVR